MDHDLNPYTLAADLLADAAKPKVDYTQDPVAWATDAAGVHLWSKQRTVLESVRDHRRTAVHSCHGIGKTFTAAVAAAWWIDSHPPGEAFVLTTAPTAPQVKALLWREINRLHNRAGLPGRVNLTEWYIPNAAGGEELVAFGRTTSKDNEAAFQGIHSRYVLVVLDEASGVAPDIWNAAESIASNRNARILAIGNPDLSRSPLADACKPESPYNVIHIGIEHAPASTGEDIPEVLHDYLISAEWAEDRRREWGEDSALYQAKVLGRFPTGDVDPWQVIAESDVAQCRYLEYDIDPDAVRVGGIDVGGGGDRTVIVERVGDRVGRVRSFLERDPMRAADRLAALAVDWGLERVNVDVIGVGWGLAGVLRERLPGVQVRGVNFAARSSQSRKFVNLRAECWWRGRDLSRERLWSLSGLDDDAVAELTTPRYELRNGRILIEEKSKVREQLGRSPDIADALLLAFYDGGVGLGDGVDARRVFAGADLSVGGSGLPSPFGGTGMPGFPVVLPTSFSRRV